MYFDAVVDNDNKPIFNGTTKDVLAWLSTHMIFAPLIQVYVGPSQAFLSVEDYIDQYS